MKGIERRKPMSQKSAFQEGLIAPNAEEGPKREKERSPGLNLDVCGSLHALSALGPDDSVLCGCPVS